jgi:hypothetical protein
MRFERASQWRGEADECTCAQCRGVDLPDWLQRFEERQEERPDAG